MVAKEYCSDSLVAGVQFDLEPFDITQSGQAAFYKEIAQDFASDSPDFGCKNATYPKGRFFSVFTFANNVTQDVADIFNSHGNGYIVDSLYDLGSTPGGTIKTPAQFTSDAETEIQLMMSRAKQFNMHYQFAIPAAASAHEFESKAGVSTGYLQSDYVQKAFDAINKFSAKQDPYFLGNDVWSWNDKMFWGGDAYTPAKPNNDNNTLTILQHNL